MNQPVKIVFSRDHLLATFVGLGAIAWGLYKFTQLSVGNIVSGLGWIVFGSSAILYVLMSLCSTQHKLAWKYQRFGKYAGFAIILIALFLPRP